MKCEWLEADADNEYSLDAVRGAFEVVPLEKDGYLILNFDKDRFWLNFAVLRWQSSNQKGGDVHCGMVFHGSGPTGSLRELRHTWWGEDGYLFYVPGALVSNAFKALSAYFDDVGGGSL
jgi:hypothetical protein